MSWRPHSHARVNSQAPEAWGKCDRCSSVFNLCDLRYQREWAGPKLINKRLRVCSGCMDKPQEQLRLNRLTADPVDPVPVRDPRPLNNQTVMGGYAVMQRYAQPPGIGLDLDVVTAAQDTGYIAPPFRDILYDSNADAGPDAGIGENPGIPLSIDPPED